MAEGSLARRYARALVGLGQEADAVDRIARDLAAFATVLDLGDGAIRAVISNPAYTLGQRAGVLDDVLGRLDLHDYSLKFLRYLVAKNRFAAFDGIRVAYEQMADELANRVRATVTTATPLGDEMAGRVKTALEKATGKSVAVEHVVDPSLIGGVVAKLGDTVYDASVSARLQSIAGALVRDPGAGGLA